VLCGRPVGTAQSREHSWVLLGGKYVVGLLAEPSIELGSSHILDLRRIGGVTMYVKNVLN